MHPPPLAPAPRFNPASAARSAPLCIVQTGSTLPHLRDALGDFDDWIAQAVDAVPDLPITTLDASAGTLPAWDSRTPSPWCGIVVTGSHAMVTDQTPWMVHTGQWLRAACELGVPVLGICFGHQLLAHALGGQVGPHPQGLEIGTVPISIQTDTTADPLWQDMPRTLPVHTVHYQSVRKLPPGSTLIAGNAHEAHHAFRWGPHAWGVQFHPEFPTAAMQGYAQHLREQWQAHGVAPLPCTCMETPDANGLLLRFARYAQGWHQRSQHDGASALAAAPQAQGQAH